MTNINDVFGGGWLAGMLKNPDGSKYVNPLFENGRRVKVTIEAVTIEEFPGRGGNKEKKIGLHFVGKSQGLVCNKTNALTIGAALQSGEIEDWVGHDIEIFFDPNITFGGQKVGGLVVGIPASINAPPFEPQSAEPRQVPPSPYPEQASSFDEDSIPF